MPERVFVNINGPQHDLRRAVDPEGEVLQSVVTKRRNKKAASKFLKKMLKWHGCADTFVTDLLRSYGAALRDIGAVHSEETGRWKNNRAKNSHQPFRRRERAMLRFRRMRSLQRFVAVHSSIHNLFNAERALTNRDIFKANRAAGLTEWRQLCAA
jgi:putative transposase